MSMFIAKQTFEINIMVGTPHQYECTWLSCRHKRPSLAHSSQGQLHGQRVVD